MKKLFLLFFIFSGIFLAQEDVKYTTAMKKFLSKIDSSLDSPGYISIANGFERIAIAEKSKWLPYYYAAFCYTLASYTEEESIDKDLLLDKAVRFITTADSIQPDNSEIYTLLGMIAQARMQIDPMNRWMKYGIEAEKHFKKAMELDSLNPRPEYLIGIGLFYTPAQFGGGPEAARSVLEKSLAKYNLFVPESDIAPDWGREMVVQLLSQIEKQSVTDSAKTK
ncbi:MAG: hypothetical protein Kow0098_08010 [Ignavibacteriaceae bacterium]